MFMPAVRTSLLLSVSFAAYACVVAETGRPGESGRGLQADDQDTADFGETVSESMIDQRRLAAALRSPFIDAPTESYLFNCPADPSADPCTNNQDCTATNALNRCYIDPSTGSGRCGHHRRWEGDWAIDLFKDGGPDATCDQQAYLRLSPGAIPGGTPPDRLRVEPGSVTPACRSGDVSRGGYDQTFTVYATRDGVEQELGTILVAHLDNVVYTEGFEGDLSDLDPTELYIGDVWEPEGELCDYDDAVSCNADEGCDWDPCQRDEAGNKINPSCEDKCRNTCWEGCHLHLELKNDNGFTESCWQNMCGDGEDDEDPTDGIMEIPAWGTKSVIGFLGGSDDGDMCERFDSEESMACATWDHDLEGCNIHGINDPNKEDDTQDCAYYTTTEVCRPRGTSNCQAGIPWDCGGSESDPCSRWDGDIGGCDLHGITDPNKNDDTQDCAYYFISQRCMSRGTSNCMADCDGCIGAGCAQCYEQCATSHPEL
ncbi:MAG: hypothetical protein AAGF11_13705 [Myxococcota bacterium]